MLGNTPGTEYAYAFANYHAGVCVADITSWQVESIMFYIKLIWYKYNNSHAVGMAVPRTCGFEIDFVKYLITESAVSFFLIILKFILTLIFEVKIH